MTVATDTISGFQNQIVFVSVTLLRYSFQLRYAWPHPQSLEFLKTNLKLPNSCIRFELRIELRIEYEINWRRHSKAPNIRSTVTKWPRCPR